MKFIVVLALILVVACANDRVLFQEFKRKFNKQYSAEEEATRFMVFQDNLKRIRDHNAADHSFTVGINQFSDLTNAEYRQKYLINLNVDPIPVVDSISSPTYALDWRNPSANPLGINAVTPVKDQGQCGSCWTFSTTGMIEGCTVVDGGSLVSLSEAEIVDCDKKDYGCNGGWPYQAMEWVTENKGICTEAGYPYTPRDEPCKIQCTSVATLNSHTQVAAGDEAALAKACSSYGPISVAIDASNWSFQTYKSGVYDEPNCSSSSLDHAVLVVGYGTDGGKDFWLVKNSWATSWGTAGYIEMSRNKHNQCGIATQAWYGQGCHNL
jgi:cathepsin L